MRYYDEQCLVEEPKGSYVAEKTQVPQDATGKNTEVEDIFNELYIQWCDKVKFDSFIGNSTNIYQDKIVQLGYSAVPLIIDKLRTENAHLFIALNRITGENPVKKENRGNVKKMTEDWIQWWNERNYVMG